jgi:hypothetical protein
MESAHCLSPSKTQSKARVAGAAALRWRASRVASEPRRVMGHRRGLALHAAGLLGTASNSRHSVLPSWN